ncbi:hypothetical protein C7S20_16535 [Christiangramia fulva]|uniref:Uncharacterized protein n=1 Tax=Christiangramia fulva TaxID=2126553 RepID=A0A2R3Z904_9FLAO|nr:DUF6452 family protein [Christiangramia fulva]AVR46743.1 hypothetical protein C7S20_16535 [Christiangramia fulva]
MKRSSVILILLVLVSVISCQRDDICPEKTDTTPLLIIRFHENQDPFDLKAPQNLNVRELGNDSSYIYYRYSRDSIAIPLRTDQDVTELLFTVNAPDTSATNPVPGITDTLRFSYGREQEYLNRACAYKVNFVGLNIELTDPASAENWIDDITIEQPNVEDEKQAHVSIFF